MQRRLLAASAIAVGGAAIAVTAALATSGGPANSPMPQAHPVISSTPPAPPAPVAHPSSAAPVPSPAPAVPVVDAPPVHHASPTPRTAHSTRSTRSGYAPSDAVRYRVYQEPLNPRPQGQQASACCQPGTKSPATGASDSPITTPTPLPNPAVHQP